MTVLGVVIMRRRTLRRHIHDALEVGMTLGAIQRRLVDDEPPRPRLRLVLPPDES